MSLTLQKFANPRNFKPSTPDPTLSAPRLLVKISAPQHTSTIIHIMDFEVFNTEGAARRGRLSFPRGTVETPAFMPVGTYGTVKTLTPEEVRASGAEIILGNTFHPVSYTHLDVYKRQTSLIPRPATARVGPGILATAPPAPPKTPSKPIPTPALIPSSSSPRGPAAAIPRLKPTTFRFQRLRRQPVSAQPPLRDQRRCPRRSRIRRPAPSPVTPGTSVTARPAPQPILRIPTPRQALTQSA